MTGVMIGYSSLFMRFAWRVQPRNYLLLACHTFNVAAQMNQLRRSIEYKLANSATAMEELTAVGQRAAAVGAALALTILSSGRVKSALSSPNMPGFVRSLSSHPAGPFTIFFWAPTSKWFLSGANLLNVNKPTDTISLAQTTALTMTGALRILFFPQI